MDLKHLQWDLRREGAHNFTAEQLLDMVSDRLGTIIRDARDAGIHQQ